MSRSTFERIAFWWRTRRMSGDLRIALTIRKRGRSKRQRAAHKGAHTKFEQRMEGLKR